MFGLQHRHRQFRTQFSDEVGGREPGQAGPDHEHVDVLAAVGDRGSAFRTTWPPNGSRFGKVPDFCSVH
ncbi:Uncharacterised protein [Mycobacteroides abscessus subsp. abscessus]|nr:Uncharacterised protein [Mycobacteroides abscessus subsp. abscessus]